MPSGGQSLAGSRPRAPPEAMPRPVSHTHPRAPPLHLVRAGSGAVSIGLPWCGLPRQSRIGVPIPGGTLIRWLLDHDLVDEIQLIIVPVVLCQGARLFPDAGPDIALELVDSRTDSKGVTIQVYRPAGRPQDPA